MAVCFIMSCCSIFYGFLLILEILLFREENYVEFMELFFCIPVLLKKSFTCWLFKILFA